MTKSKYVFLSSLFLLILFLASRDQSNFKKPHTDVENVMVKAPTKIELTVMKYDSLMTRELVKSETVGAAVAIVHKNDIAFLKCYGLKKIGSRDSIDKRTVFRLASVSKPITGILAGIMEDEGIIKLDDKVIDYLPNFKLKDSTNTYNLTIRNILSHTSGLVPHAYDNLVEGKVPFNSIIDSLQRVDISADPGKLYGYQNVIFSLYDTIASIKTARKFGDLLVEKIFKPFDMNYASSGFDAFKENKNKAYPHYRNKHGYKSLPLNDRYYNTIPAAGINASIQDMAQLLRCILSNDTSFNNYNFFDTVFTPQVISPLKRGYLRQWGHVDTKHYAIGWRIIGYKGRTIAYHGGFVRGYRAEVALCREENIGIVFLSNSPNSVASISVPVFLNLFFDSETRQDT